MRATLALGAALLLAGLAVLAYAVATGEASIALVLVFPVIFGTGWLSVLGALLVFGGAAVAMLGWAQGLPSSGGAFSGFPWETMQTPPKDDDEWDRRMVLPRPDFKDPEGPPPLDLAHPRRTESGGFILLGPIPIAWGTDRGLAGLMALMVVLALAALVLMLFLPMLLGRGGP